VACGTGQLSASLGGGSGAAGTIETTVALRNTSARTCVVAGYPSLHMVDARGAKVPTRTMDGGSYRSTSQAQTMVTLPPGQSGSFNIVYADVPRGSEASCPSSAAPQITLPSNYDPLTVPASLSTCNGGTLVVSRILAGATGGR
jgi:hypothetical protein